MQTRETPVDHWRFNLSNNPYCPASKPGDHGLGGNAGMWTSSLDLSRVERVAFLCA
jgi:hypothetical protein